MSKERKIVRSYVMTESLYALLEDAAHARNLSYSAIMREALTDYLVKHKFRELPEIVDANVESVTVG